MRLRRFLLGVTLIVSGGTLATRVLGDMCAALPLALKKYPNVPPTTILITLPFAFLKTVMDDPRAFQQSLIDTAAELSGAMIFGFLVGRVVWIWHQREPERSDFYTHHLKWIGASAFIYVLSSVLQMLSRPAP